ncbi:Helix-turn-helix, type 11 domain protein [Desulfurococcus amylolyticus 1221n]|uniref:Helix-turn-helix, type 11 domain protein n=1 Tax=Desulfurococcus amylolyticus (strain DSM 18924 / JCM 16383 / VKM B-2413 / 1221n) TaxID=490899 RepID=B8D4Q9_DESA1|nr:helix-turn-helix domain-containing protein [Desulfurococcus amylolyticus]ACL11090.1 Helix-turn-helix, type 11 domain protein [Desulfurococcus amylolyticus 1221n]
MIDLSEQKTVKEKLLEFLSNQDKPLMPKEISRLTGINYNTVRARLHDLRKEGLVERVLEGWIAKKT